MHALMLYDTRVATCIEHRPAARPERETRADPLTAADLLDAHRVIDLLDGEDGEILDHETFHHARDPPAEEPLEIRRHPLEPVPQLDPLSVGEVGEKGEVRRTDKLRPPRRQFGGIAPSTAEGDRDQRNQPGKESHDPRRGRSILEHRRFPPILRFRVPGRPDSR